MRNLIIAAHPDDEILGCAGLINKLKKQGIDSYVLILTDGAAGRYPKRMASVLKAQARKANEAIGTKKVFFEDFPNQELETIALTRIIKKIEECIVKLKIGCLFTHHSGDLNKDHRIVYEASVTAARPFSGQTVKRVYSYNVASSTEWNAFKADDIFIPNFFIDIRDEIKQKIRSMSYYRAECRTYPHPRSSKALMAYAHYWGLRVGIEYAEAFKLLRELR